MATEYVDAIELSNGTEAIATATEPTANGSWVLEPDPEAAWFGPDGRGTTFSLRMEIAADAPGGKSVALEIPPANDSDGDGAYDPGDTGIFVEQGDPRGGIGPGPIHSVPETEKSEKEGPTPIALSLTVPENVSGRSATLPITVAGNDSDRSVRVTLRDLETESILANQTRTLNATGQVSLEVEATPGRYRVQVSARKGAAAGVSETVRVELPRNATLSARTQAVERGELARFSIDSGNGTSGTVRLEGPDGERLETVTLIPEHGSPPYEIGIETGTQPGARAGDGYHLETPNGNDSNPLWFTGLESNHERRGRTGNGAGNGQSSSRRTGSSGNMSGGAVARNNTASNESLENSGGKDSGLAAGTYRVSVRTEDGSRANTTFEVTAPWLVDLTPFVAPRDVTLDNGTAVKDHISKRDAIAAGDTLVLEVNTSDLEGFDETVSVGGPPPHAAAEARKGRNQSPNGSVAPQAKRNTPPAFVSIHPGSKETTGQNRTRTKRINTSDPNHFYVVLPDAGKGTRPGSALESKLVLTEATPFVPSGGNDTATESTNTSLAVREPSATFDGLSSNETLDFRPKEGVSITGSTNLAPGTNGTVHVVSETESIDLEQSVRIQEDGRYRTTANFSDCESGTNYTVSLTADGDQVSELRSGSFVGSESKTDAASGGGGGGWISGQSSQSTDRTATTETITETPTTDPDPLSEPVSELSRRAVHRVWEPLPEPIQLGLSAFVILGLGALAVLVMGIGVKQLLAP